MLGRVGGYGCPVIGAAALLPQAARRKQLQKRRTDIARCQLRERTLASQTTPQGPPGVWSAVGEIAGKISEGAQQNQCRDLEGIGAMGEPAIDADEAIERAKAFVESQLGMLLGAARGKDKERASRER